MPKFTVTDDQIKHIIGNLLRAGVFLAASVAFLGGVFYLAHNGMSHPDYRTFHGEPGNLRSVPLIVRDAAAFQSGAVIQLGLLLLVLTPVARVAFSAVAFALERDRLYVCLTLGVLAVLLYSLLGAK